MRAAILLSGGLDSTALAYWVRPVLAITVDYGQIAAAAEFRAARAVCRHLGMAHEELKIDLRQLGSGVMAGVDQSCLAATSEWWPFRNQLLITLAGAIAIRHNIEELLLGSVISDSEHGDGTQRFFELADALMQSQEGHLRVRAPGLNISSEDLILKSGVPISVLGWCHSCNVSETPCLNCRACKKQVQTLSSLGFF